MNMLRNWTLASLLAASAAVPLFVERAALAEERGKGEEITLAVGETKVLPASGIKNYSAGLEGVVDVRLPQDGSQFVITGKKPGTTTLLLIRNDNTQVSYEIIVSQRPPQTVERELSQLISNSPGVKVRRIGGRFFIEGYVSSDSEAKRIAQIATAYGGMVENLVVVGQGAADRKLIVRLDFFFIQYDKTSGYAVGVGYPSSIGGESIQSTAGFDFISGTVTSAQATVVNQPLPRLDLAARRGWAKVLKQSTVLTANGSEAEFQSGGEQNYALVGGLSAAVRSINYGTNVKVLPRYNSVSREVEVHLGADVADVIPPVTLAGAISLPGRATTKLDTNITLKLGQGLVLSGIKTRGQRRDVAGLPLLSEIPVLGVFFGTHRNEETETEGAVFIVPSVIESVPKSSLDMIRRAVDQFNSYSGNMKSVDTFDKRPPSAQ